MNFQRKGNMIVCSKLVEYDLSLLDQVVDRRHVYEPQDVTVAHVMTRFNKKVVFTPEAVEQIDARVKARKLVNLKEYKHVMGGTY